MGLKILMLCAKLLRLKKASQKLGAERKIKTYFFAFMSVNTFLDVTKFEAVGLDTCKHFRKTYFFVSFPYSFLLFPLLQLAYFISRTDPRHNRYWYSVQW